MKKQICLIDDDEIYHFIFKKQVSMSDKEVEVLSFANGQKGIDYMETADLQNLPNVIFLDINMPVMDGWGFLEIFNESIVEGTYFPVSIEKIVCLETFNKSPNSC